MTPTGSALSDSNVPQRLIAEFLGTAGLLLAIVGSGIRADPRKQLFHHSVVVGATLAALIASLGWVPGAHFNPAVTMVKTLLSEMSSRIAGWYVSAQIIGAAVGVIVGNLLYGLPAVSRSTTPRFGFAMGASESVASGY